MEIKFEAAAPVLISMDVGATARWYEEFLGFKAALFPDRPPFAFAILSRDGAELVVRHSGPAGLPRADGNWNVHFRVSGVQALYHDLNDRVTIVEPLRSKSYGRVEFTLRDPNGLRLVFSEKASPS